MLVRPVLEMDCVASLPERVADENKRREMGGIRTGNDRDWRTA
jgi:hypothetical protein